MTYSPTGMVEPLRNAPRSVPFGHSYLAAPPLLTRYLTSELTVPLSVSNSALLACGTLDTLPSPIWSLVTLCGLLLLPI